MFRVNAMAQMAYIQAKRRQIVSDGIRWCQIASDGIGWRQMASAVVPTAAMAQPENRKIIMIPRSPPTIT